MIFNKKQVRRLQIKMLLTARGPYKRAEFLRKNGVFFKMGQNCFYQPNSLPTEPFLLSLGDNVYVCANVRFITHDVLGDMLKNDSDFSKKVSALNTHFYMNKIVIGSNVVIGADTDILYGVTVGDNVIIGAGSVVTHDIPSGKVAAGNPAVIIGDYEDLANRRICRMADMPKKTDGEEKLISYFWK